MQTDDTSNASTKPHQRMLVVLPERLTVSHLWQCHRYLEDREKYSLLYAANTAHMSLYTILVVVTYSEGEIDVMRSAGTELYPGGPKEGGTVKDFLTLIRDIDISNHEREPLILLNDIRNRMQHPIPGPMGYIVVDLIAGIEVAVRVGMDLWNSKCVRSQSDGTIYAKALMASQSILETCAALRLGNAR